MRESAEQRGFAVHPRRWVAQRTPAWFPAHRRPACDYERHPEVSEAIVIIDDAGLLQPTLVSTTTPRDSPNC